MSDEAPYDNPEATAAATDTAELKEQISKLQSDIMAISATLQRLTGEKIAEAQKTASGQYEQAMRQGRHMFEDVTDQATELERSLKHTIREKPLTAVATALGIGYVLALLSRH
jgi:ElaB/YqjD/DUF883 family membrane-anchored ribosome-binding protein